MTEVHRYSVVKMLSEGGNSISYDPRGPEVVMASAYDQLKAENETLRQVMSAVVAEIPGAHTSRSGNAPGHCHSIPGVWDRDNGAKAGKECAWCTVWNYAVAMGNGEKP